jgi:hypothetical protein
MVYRPVSPLPSPETLRILKAVGAFPIESKTAESAEPIPKTPKSAGEHQEVFLKIIYFMLKKKESYYRKEAINYNIDIG